MDTKTKKEKILNLVKEGKTTKEISQIMNISYDTVRYYRSNKSKYKTSEHRRKIKSKLIGEFGGACKVCNYSKCESNLVFHHLDPSSKEFGISSGGMTRAYSKILEEAKKCVLLCSNCHGEVHAGIIHL